MIWQQLRKVNDSYIVTIPKEEVERLNLREGQLLAIEIHPSEIDSVISTDVGMVLKKVGNETNQDIVI